MRQRNLKAPKNQEKSEKNARTNMTFLKCVPEKQESTVYFVWGQRLFPVMYDPFAPRRSSNRETLTRASRAACSTTEPSRRRSPGVAKIRIR